MLARMRSRLSYANVMSTLAVFLALGGSAYAINEWTGANIVDSSLTGADVKGKAGTSTTPSVNGSLTTDDIAGQQANAANGSPFIDGTLTQWDIKNNSLTGSDVLESSLGKVPNADTLDGIDSASLVQGRGTLLSNRIVFNPAVGGETLLQIPGLGELQAYCGDLQAMVLYDNTSGGPVDFWSNFGGRFSGYVASSPGGSTVANSNRSGSDYGSTVGLGVGNPPGARRVATLHVFALQTSNGAPCGFQAQGTLWVSP